jgi:hypothetical protein
MHDLLRRGILAALAAALVLAAPLAPARAGDPPAPAKAGDPPAAPGAPAAPADPATPASPDAPAAPKFPGLPWKAATHGKGRLEVLPSGLAVLHLAGTPEEMGEQHGTLLREPIRFLVEKYLPKVLRGEREAALGQARLLGKQIPERMVREMAATAKAAGVPADDILLGTVVVELFGLNMCSGIAAFGPATAGGAMIVGRNLEWPDHGMLGQYGLVVACRPDGHRPFVSVGFPAMVGVVTGWNADGLFTSELVVMQAANREAGVKGVPYPVLQRRILEECRTLAAGVELVKGAPRTVPQNLFLADPRDAAVLECSADRFVVRPAKDGLLAVTNHFDEPAAPSPYDPRYKGICKALEGIPKGAVDAAAVEKVARSAAAGWLNLQCMVVHPGTLRASVAVGSPPASERPFVEIDGAALLGVTATPAGDRERK